MKLLILILASYYQPYYDVYKNGVMKTWASKKYENIEIYTTLGNHKSTEIIGNEMHINCPDNYITTKTLKGFEYSLNNLDFDFLIRTNTSTYIRVDKIYEYLKNKPRNEYYGGHKNDNILGITYPSGTNMMYSIDLVEKIVKGKKYIRDNEWADDWCIGKYLQNKDIKMTDELSHYWMLSTAPDEKYIKEKVYTLKREDVENYITFRCKTEIPNPNMKRNDHLKMQHLYKIFN